MAQTVIDFSTGVIDATAGGQDNTLQVGDFIFTIQAQGNWTASISGDRFNFQEAAGSTPFTITITTASGAQLDFYDYQVSVNGTPDLIGGFAATAYIDNTSWGDENYNGNGLGGGYYYRASFGGQVPAVVLGNSLTITDQYQPGGVTSAMSIWMDNITFEVGAPPTQNAPSLSATGKTPTFTEGGSAVDLFDSVTANTNNSGQTFSSMTLSVSNVSAGDALMIDGKTVVLSAGQSGALTQSGNYSVSMNGTTATVALTGLSLSNSLMGQLVNNMSFSSTNENPIPATRAITIVEVRDNGPSNNSFSPNLTAEVSVLPVNDPHTGGVSITGSATENGVLTATSTLADLDGLGTLHYDWQRDTGSGFVSIGAADQATYTLGDADVGYSVRVMVAYTDGGGIVETSASTGTAAVSAVNDPHTGGVAISGTATEDQVLTAASTLADVDGLGTLHYDWQRDTGSGFVSIGAADQSTYTLGDVDVDSEVRVVVSYVDGQGFSESATSAGTATVAAVNDPHTGGVAISGTATEDQVLTAASTLADVDGLGTLHYDWQRDTGSGFVSIGAPDQATYTLGDADVGSEVRVVVSYLDGQGFSESATSAGTAAVSAVNDPHTGGVAISGTATEDQVLTAASTLADLDGLGTLHYDWQRDTGSGFVSIGAADQATYTLGDADVGSEVRVVVSYLDGQGFTESATSAGTATVAAVNDPHTGGVAISGTATEDQVLTATSTLADVDGLGTLHYDWQRDTGAGFISIGAADQSTYTLGDADVGSEVRVVVSYLDGQGFTETATSAGTASIANINDVPTIGGDVVQSLVETNSPLSTSGALTISDIDSGESSFQALANVRGSGGYGLFSIDAAGAWTYQMDGPHDEFVAGSTYTDSVVVLSADGTPTTISVNILGTADNQAPVVSLANADVGLQGGYAFSLIVGDGHFSDPDGNTDLDYSISVDGRAAPAWMSFDAETGTLSGLPTEAGVYNVVVTASDGALSASDEFVLAFTALANTRGTKGDDTIVGDDLDNVVDGRRGNDNLTGGAGADTFVFGSKYGRDVISDFNPAEGDIIDLSGAKGIRGFQDLMKHHAVDAGEHVKITADDGSILVIRNFELDDLSRDMFSF